MKEATSKPRQQSAPRTTHKMFSRANLGSLIGRKRSNQENSLLSRKWEQQNQLMQAVSLLNQSQTKMEQTERMYKDQVYNTCEEVYLKFGQKRIKSGVSSTNNHFLLARQKKNTMSRGMQVSERISITVDGRNSSPNDINTQANESIHTQVLATGLETIPASNVLSQSKLIDKAPVESKNFRFENVLPTRSANHPKGFIGGKVILSPRKLMEKRQLQQIQQETFGADFQNIIV